MKLIRTLTNERFAKPAAHFLKLACYFVICFYILCMVLSFLGRQTFFLHTSAGTFENAIYAEESHDSSSRTMTVSIGGSTHVWADDEGQIDFSVQLGLSLLYAVHVLPLIFAFWLLSRVFSNIQQGEIFTEQNSSYLLYYGLLQFSAAVFVPLVKLLICWLVNLVSSNRMSISTGQALFNQLIPSIAFIVAAYIIHYGVHLQDEVDHTI